MDKYDGKYSKRLYRCCSNYAVIVDNGLRIYGEGRAQIFSEFTGYDRSFGKDPG